VRNGRGITLNHTNEINRKTSNFMLVGIAVLFIAIVLLAVIYAVGDKPKSKMTINQNDSDYLGPSEIITSDNALVYNETMLGVITEIDTDEKTMTLLNVASEEERTLRFSGGTNILDKYDNMMAVSQLSEGLMVDVYFIEEEEKLVKVQISKDAWEQIGVTGLIINEEKGILSFNSQRYPLLEQVVVLDQADTITLSDILEMDYVIVRGTSEKVCVVKRTRGHGYIELANEEDYIGGMIHVGTEVIQQITPEMKIAVREGTYSVTVNNGDLTGTQEVVIEKDKTAKFDLYPFSSPVLSTGLVHFDITPAQAILYVDGVETNFISPVELTYGEHRIEVSLGGYVTYKGTILVDSTDQTIRISLSDNSSNGPANGNQDLDTDIEDDLDYGDEDNTLNEDGFEDNTSEDNTSEDDTSEDEGIDDDYESDNEDEDESEDESEDENDTEDEPTIGGIDESSTMTISCSEGAKVYIDGTYIGTITDGKLVSKKYIGTHTIELVLDGHGRKTYTIDLDDDGENAVLNFPSF